MLAHLQPQAGAQRGVQAGEGLVEQDDGRARGPAPGRGRRAAAGRRTARAACAGEVREADEVEQLVDAPPALGPRGRAAQPVGDVAPRRSGAGTARPPGRPSPRGALGRHECAPAGHELSADGDAPGVGRLEPGDEAQGGRSCRSRRARAAPGTRRTAPPDRRRRPPGWRRRPWSGRAPGPPSGRARRPSTAVERRRLAPRHRALHRRPLGFRLAVRAQQPGQRRRRDEHQQQGRRRRLA